MYKKIAILGANNYIDMIELIRIPARRLTSSDRNNIYV